MYDSKLIAQVGPSLGELFCTPQNTVFFVFVFFWGGGGGGFTKKLFKTVFWGIYKSFLVRFPLSKTLQILSIIVSVESRTYMRN